MFAETATRSTGNAHIRAAVASETLRTLERYAERVEDIDARLRELDAEWDIERAIEANAATLALTGTILGMVHDRRWLYLPLAVTGFLLQHATQGWCPPVPVLRRLGFRTQVEIERERYALKALRGDFRDIGGDGASIRERVARAFKAVR